MTSEAVRELLVLGGLENSKAGKESQVRISLLVVCLSKGFKFIPDEFPLTNPFVQHFNQEAESAPEQKHLKKIKKVEKVDHR